LRAWVLRGEPLCRTCATRGRTVAADEVDHVVPLFLGGANGEDNLQPLCRACHVEKSIAERRADRPGYDEQGMPRDTAHHWNETK
jgi:5-methylcytosine-specific restriction enzyme A